MSRSPLRESCMRTKIMTMVEATVAYENDRFACSGEVLSPRRATTTSLYVNLTVIDGGGLGIFS
ncbi:hypothetical protein TIFTF001_014049 [Ficus carica]|uniref:Uncharacterized protein n=1 Tax=Ficus carica TaxID=3494 RepID=A0AA88A5E1_FICCA|nr:hypothetical protein TIFTF001_014049 [Ficus carica]